MNDIYARRLAQGAMFHQLMRSHGTLWAATRVTKEKLDYDFIREEFMRVNGRRTMPLLIGAAANENLNQLHLTHLTEHCAWAESPRARAVQQQTPLTEHIASMGRMAETIHQTKTSATMQNLFHEQISQAEGISSFEEEPIFEDGETLQGEVNMYNFFKGKNRKESSSTHAKSEMYAREEVPPTVAPPPPSYPGPPPQSPPLAPGPPPQSPPPAPGPPPHKMHMPLPMTPPNMPVSQGYSMVSSGALPPPGAKFIMKGPPPPGAKLIMKKSPQVPPGMKIMVKGPLQLPPGMMMVKGPPPPGAKFIMKDTGRSPPGTMFVKSKSPAPIAQTASRTASSPLSPRMGPAPPSAPSKTAPQKHEAKEIPVPARHKSSHTASIASPSEVPERPHAPKAGENDSDDLNFVVEGKDNENDTPLSSRPETGGSRPQRASHAAAKGNREEEFSRSTSRNSSILFHVPGDSAGGSPASRDSSTMFNIEGEETATPLEVSRNSRRVSTASHRTRDKNRAPPLQVLKKDFLKGENQSNKDESRTQKKHEKGHNVSSSHKERLNETPKRIPVKGNEKLSSIASDTSSPVHHEATRKREPSSRSRESRVSDKSGCPHSVLSNLQANYIGQSLESKSKLTPEERGRIAEHFFSILSPEQFYGKITKIHSIRLVNADRESVTGLKKYSSIFLATKGALPNQFFYPQLRLTDSDRFLKDLSDCHPDGYVGTHIVLYEAAPGNMLFAETELDARRLLKYNKNSESCFVVEKSAIVFRDPPKHVLPIAMLTVEWIPYAVPQSEPQCPVHHKELQLFDRSTKELLCALCVSKTGVDMSDLVIIPDVLSGDSRRRIMETLAQQLEKRNLTASQWVRNHQDILSTVQRKKDTVNKQFDLLVSAINSKREEYLEACDASYGLNLSRVAKEVLMADEKIRLLRAAVDHLRTESTRPMYSMQVATVANALSLVDQFPQNFSQESVKGRFSTIELTPNLERVMGEVQRLSPRKRRETNTVNNISSHSPFHPRMPTVLNDWSFMDVTSDSNDSEPASLQMPNPRARTSAYAIPSIPKRMDRSRERYCSNRVTSSAPSRSASAMMLKRGGSQIDTRWPRRTQRGQSVPLLNRTRSAERMSRGGYCGQEKWRHNQWVALPGCRGTCVFNFPIHRLLAESFDDTRPTHIRSRCLQWTLRVDDPGDWIGIGVGVGGTVETWARSRTPDLSHMWVVPCGGTRKFFVMRVSVNSSIGYAKLSIHDRKGKRLDDGRIPQWNAFRSCYPQVTFGGRIGEVLLTERPRFLRS